MRVRAEIYERTHPYGGSWQPTGHTGSPILLRAQVVSMNTAHGYEKYRVIENDYR